MVGPSECAAAFKGSAIKRATLWMPERNARVVRGNVGTSDDLAVLQAMREHAHEIGRESAAWGAARLAPSTPTARPFPSGVDAPQLPRRRRSVTGPTPSVVYRGHPREPQRP